MRRSQIIMGTGVTLDIPNINDIRIFDDVFGLLKNIDERFSTYKNDSELSRYQRREINQKNLSPEMKEVKTDCEKYEKHTDGYFSAYFSGKFDPTGYVKGWSIDRAGKLIKKNGFDVYCLSIGGDILASSDGAKEWTIGVQDPTDNKKILNKLSIFSGAVATSGSYERGQHIINPKSGKLANELLSVTVIGPDIIKADVLATACFAMGNKATDFMKTQKSYQALLVRKK